MSSRTALEALLIEGGLRVGQARGVRWAVKAADGNCPNEELVAHAIMRLVEQRVERSLAAVGYDNHRRARRADSDDTLPLFPHLPELPPPPLLG